MTVGFIQAADLLDLADELVGRGAGAGRPKVIKLRRGVSSGYYAIFHELSYRVVQRVREPKGWGQRESAVARWVTHTLTWPISRKVPRGDAGVHWRTLLVR